MTRARDLAAFVSNADGDIKFDTDTLFIDSSANRVGIGTTTVDSLLHIKGANPEYRIEDNNETGSANVVFRDSARETAKISVASGSSANMQFQTLGSERMRIDDSGNVGIGASSPSAMLDVVSSGTGSETVAEFGNANISNGLIIETNGNLDWGFNATNSRNMTFSTNQTERMRLLAGGGLTFNGDTAAANALDDYEEGSFTPVIYGGTSAGTGTYSFQRGSYIKVGKFVYVQMDIGWSAHTGTGAMGISGLPFTTGTFTSTAYGTPNISYASGLTWTKDQLGGYVASNDTKINLRAFDNAGSLVVVSMDTSVTELLLSATYIAA